MYSTNIAKGERNPKGKFIFMKDYQSASYILQIYKKLRTILLPMGIGNIDEAHQQYCRTRSAMLPMRIGNRIPKPPKINPMADPQREETFRVSTKTEIVAVYNVFMENKYADKKKCSIFGSNSLDRLVVSVLFDPIREYM
ncbi:hypothetical protein D0T51_00965 [Parabacteroides sp. 52]|nr:hypothetical protein [Parabacteroides sp. 52]